MPVMNEARRRRFLRCSAVSGAPTTEPRAAELAIRCAVDMQKRVKAFNEKQAEADGPTIHIGIGIHTGPAIVGLLGSARRLEYTAIAEPGNTGVLRSRIRVRGHRGGHAEGGR